MHGATVPGDARGAAPIRARHERSPLMLVTIAVLLLVLWALGLITSYTLGGFIHLLLLLAIISVLIRIIQGRRPI
jgi:hypothetical protein